MPFTKLMVLALAIGAAPHEKPAAEIAWYTQIGFWHHHKDSLSGKSFIFHNANVDGAQSGQATANVRLNKGFEGIQKFQARMTLGPAPATAGMLVQNKQATYYFLIKKEKIGNYLQVRRRNKMEITAIFIAPVLIPDTVNLRLFVKNDSLKMIAGKTTVSIVKPTDFCGTQWIGFECLQGEVKVFEAAILSNAGEMNETFENPSLINLHLEKMFPAAK